MKMAVMKIMLKVFNTYFPLHWEFFSSSTMLIFSSNMASSHYGCFLPKNAYFWTHLDLELHLGGA